MADAAARERGADTWVEKTPATLYALDLVEQLVPGAQVVHVVRDGVDVVASLCAVAEAAPAALCADLGLPCTDEMVTGRAAAAGGLVKDVEHWKRTTPGRCATGRGGAPARSSTARRPGTSGHGSPPCRSRSSPAAAGRPAAGAPSRPTRDAGRRDRVGFGGRDGRPCPPLTAARRPDTPPGRRWGAGPRGARRAHCPCERRRGEHGSRHRTPGAGR
ncbi:sulfotransferase [Blastococcus sp. KM273129]|uniref:sulfotransferase n=1 Tax=Blastococcus sp. KM273129 TaxID=2570315 RepID=UPI0035AC1A74